MRRVILGVTLACATWSVEAADLIEMGTEDLLQNAGLSQPFTVFDQLLLSLDRKAGEVAKYLRPKNNDFRPSNRVSGDATSRVYYEKSIARTVIEFDLTVSGIDDPWRDVCARRLSDITGPGGLWLPSSKESIIQDVFFSHHLGPRYLGPKSGSDYAQIANYKAFSDSIVVELRFVVESGNRTKPLKFILQCFWDNKTDQVSFQEYKY
jgi:hypothetical protein